MIRFAFANLLSRPGRTALSVIGLTIAIAGMVGLFSIAGGIDSLMESSFGDIDGIVVLQNGAPIPLFSTLPGAWGDEIAAVEGVSVVTPELWSRANLIDGKPILAPPRLLLGTDLPSWLRRRHGVFSDAMKEGRFLSADDAGTNHTVVSRQIADEFEKSVGDPIEVNGRELQLVGIYEVGSILLDVTIVVDITLLREMTHAAPDAVSAFYVEPIVGVENDVLVPRIEALFADRALPAWQPPSLLSGASSSAPTNVGQWLLSTVQGLTAGVPVDGTPADAENSTGDKQVDVSHEPDIATHQPPDEKLETDTQANSPVSVQSVVEWSHQFKDLTADLNIILTLLTGLGIAISVSSILNTMLMSVTERIVEFGILRANGWSRQDVVRLITFEAALLGVAGGILGVLFGWLATQVINRVWSDRIHLYSSPTLLISSLLFAIVVGMLGGFYPALRAARMSPMDAIRRG